MGAGFQQKVKKTGRPLGDCQWPRDNREEKWQCESAHTEKVVKGRAGGEDDKQAIKKGVWWRGGPLNMSMQMM